MNVRRRDRVVRVSGVREAGVIGLRVGSVHGFYNTGTERVRWLETQAPQPPARHSYRWVRDWGRYDEEQRARRAEESGR